MATHEVLDLTTVLSSIDYVANRLLNENKKSTTLRGAIRRLAGIQIPDADEGIGHITMLHDIEDNVRVQVIGPTTHLKGPGNPMLSADNTLNVFALDGSLNLLAAQGDAAAIYGMNLQSGGFANLAANGNLGITAGDSLNVHSTTTSNLDATGGLNVDSGDFINLDAMTDCNINTQGSLNATGQQGINVMAPAPIDISAYSGLSISNTGIEGRGTATVNMSEAGGLTLGSTSENGIAIVAQEGGPIAISGGSVGIGAATIINLESEGSISVLATGGPLQLTGNGITMIGVKSGTTQEDAGAAPHELWINTTTQALHVGI